MNKIQFKFDPGQEHQNRAKESVVELFEGFPKNVKIIEALLDECVPNIPADSIFDWDFLSDNFQKVQERNSLPVSHSLNFDEGYEFKIGDTIRIHKYPSFTLEMETGTGKTYTYLRTIHELRKQFGFGKFIVIVPSVAIYEGIIKSVEITRKHFDSYYDNEYLHFIKYDGDKLSRLRDFSNSQFLTVMVMTIASFNKITNNLFKPNKELIGVTLPHQYIQDTRPILILDECQNYETDNAREALRTLHPIFALKYSATAGNKDDSGVWQYDNLIYRLDPLEAFRRNLVKSIQVIGATEVSNSNLKAPIAIKGFHRGPEATLEVLVSKRGRRDLVEIKVKKGADLKEKTKNEDYDGWKIKNISLTTHAIEFENGETIQAKTEEQIAKEKRELFKRQIEETVRQHMQHQEKLLPDNIKVLSLYFIDRVANYRGPDALIKKLFEEAFNHYKKGYPHFKDKKVESVHDGYFAQKQTKEGLVEINTEGKKDEEGAEKRAYELIMQKKEELLSFDENVSFIFAHSALKEGWDNPNVFQICTLAQRYSERRKRQEIGRGMRLCVNQDGDRIQDSKTNILTVIANENYESFVEGLQSEYVETGNEPPPPPSNAKRSPARRNNSVYAKKEFSDFWAKLAKTTNYTIKFDTEKVINAVVARFSKEIVAPPEILVKKGHFTFARYEVSLLEIKNEKAKLRIYIKTSNGEDKDYTGVYPKGADLAKEFHDNALSGFKIDELTDDSVVFDNETPLLIGDSYVFSVQQPLVLDTSGTTQKNTSFPIFNLVDRAATETLLTRKTIIEILKRISDERKKSLFENPEGFAATLVFSINESLSNQVAENIEYALVKGLEKYDFDKLFPAEEAHPQRQLEKGSAAALYDYVQYESEIEHGFITNRLNPDKKVICYFKFPDSFKIKLPKIIGNYVPDWGVVRELEDGKRCVELVRETKSTINRNLLQYPNEQRKIACAERHFSQVGVDYRDITDKMDDWWAPAPAHQPEFEAPSHTIEIISEIPRPEMWKSYLPVYSVAAIATAFGKEVKVEPLGWTTNAGKHSKDLFVAQVVGKSMEPTIKDGSWCIFRTDPGGSREGKVVLVESRDIKDPETNGQYTIKRYHSEKEELPDGSWRHKKITLSPDNKEFADIVLQDVSGDSFRIVAEYVETLSNF